MLQPLGCQKARELADPGYWLDKPFQALQARCPDNVDQLGAGIHIL